jgi:hypothetical protein
LKTIQASSEGFPGLAGGLANGSALAQTRHNLVLARVGTGPKKKGSPISRQPLGIDSWWSWRESNPRPLECHANRQTQHSENMKYFGYKSGEPLRFCWLLPTVTSRSVAHQPTVRQRVCGAPANGHVGVPSSYILPMCKRLGLDCTTIFRKLKRAGGE